MSRTAILRAEIDVDGRTDVTCAIELTETSVFLISESLPPLGHPVHLRLSFPRVLRPVAVDATVAQIRMSGGPGSPPGFVAELDVSNDAIRRRIEEVVQRVRPRAGALTDRSLEVLLVEDNQLIRDTFAYAFERYFKQRSARLNLTQAASAEEAWKLTRPETDLVLVDHQLTSSFGTDFISRLRGDAVLGRHFVVGMSGRGHLARRAMLDAGADLFLEKPIVLKDLFCTLEFLTGTPPSWSEYGAA